jgi:aspartate/methionine/tyrosine aminotransferase
MTKYKFNDFVKRTPYEVSANLWKEARDPSVTSLAGAELYKIPPTHIIEGAKEALDNGLVHYSPIEGYMELRQAISTKLKKTNHIEADPESEILVTMGAGHAFLMAVHAFVNVGDEVITVDPSFVLNYGAPLINGGIPVSVPVREEDSFRLSPADIEKRITPKTKMVTIITPDNPTGVILRENTAKDIADLAEKHDLIILSDEVYESMRYDKTEHFSIGSLNKVKDRTISIFSFSKDYSMSGFRVGYLVANEEIKNVIANIQMNDGACASSVSQMAALAALKGPQHFLEEWNMEFSRSRDLAVKVLNTIPGVTCNKPEGGCYVFPNISKLGRSEEIAVYLARYAKVGVNPGNWYGQYGEGYIRLCYSALPLNDLRLALTRVKDVLGKLAKKKHIKMRA